MQRVNEALFFEVTELQEAAKTSKGVKMLCLAQVVRQQYPAQCFGKIPGFNPLKAFSAFRSFSPFVGHFFKRVREPQVKLRHVVYEV